MNVATPELFSGTVASVVEPSLKVTEPVGVALPEFGVTVAVNVTDCPTVEGFTELVSVVVVSVAAPCAVATTSFPVPPTYEIEKTWG